MDRKNWYFEQVVTQAELDESFDDAEDGMNERVKDLTGFGFIDLSGSHPATVEESAVPDLNVVVNALLGYDQLGRRLEGDLAGFQGGADIGTPPWSVDVSVDEVAASTAVGTPGNEKTISIFVEFERLESDPRIDGNLVPVNFVQEEAVKFNVVQSAEAAIGASVPPPLRADQLLLCDVTLINAQVAVLDADIDQARRQDYTPSLLHGVTHVEGASDPIPNATLSVGGLMSAADKTTFDGIDWSSSGIGEKLANTHYRPYAPSAFVIPSDDEIDVTGLMVGQTSGGNPTTEGIVTGSILVGSADDNQVILKTEDDDDFLDAFGNKVYGRLNYLAAVWTLKFYSNIEGSGQTFYDSSPYAGGGTTAKWYPKKAYFIHNLPANAEYSVPSDEVAAEVPTATDSLAGKVKIESDGTTTGADVALGTSDPRSGAVKGKFTDVPAGTPSAASAFKQVVHIEAGTGITVAMDASGSEIKFTITASAFTRTVVGTLAADVSGGLAGTNVTIPYGDHKHPLSTAYRMATGYIYKNQLPSGDTDLDFSGTITTPAILIAFAAGQQNVAWNNNFGQACSIGMAVRNGANTLQAAMGFGTFGNRFYPDKILQNGDDVAAEGWKVTSWGQIMTVRRGPDGDGSTPDAAFFCLGNSY